MNLWDRAKQEARINGKPDDWAHIMNLYRQLGGIEKSIILYIDNQQYELLGETSDKNVLVKSDTGEVSVVNKEVFEKSKKIFKSHKNVSKLIPVKKVVTRKDGTTFSQTFYVSPEDVKQHKYQVVEDEEIPSSPSKKVNDEEYWRNKTAELQADIGAMWQLQCRNLYSSSNLGALAVRESVQNSRDAIMLAIKSGKITKGKIDISWEGNDLTIEDNGIGMDVKTLHTKFLNLGGTTKGGEGTSIGGFGVAKAVILGSGETFEISTRNNYLDSRNLGKGKVEKTKELQGTKITIRNVEVGKDYTEDKPIRLSEREGQFERAIKDYLETSEYENMDIYIQGKRVQKRFVKTTDTFRNLSEFNITPDLIPESTNVEINVFPKSEDDWSSSELYVRLGGLTQFKTYIGGSAKCDVVLDLDVKVDPKSDKYPFTNSRESLKNKYSGITNAIRDTLNQNPLAISSKTKYKETIFDNVNKKIRDEREITKRILQTTEDSPSKDTDFTTSLEVLKKFMGSDKKEKTVGMELSGEYRPPGLVDIINIHKRSLQEKADKMGITVKELQEQLRITSREESATEENPLEHSWLIWEEKDREIDFNVAKHLPVLVVWDSICRKIAEVYSKSSIPVFYPGFILEEDVGGMSVKKNIVTREGSTEQRNFIMVNPEILKTDDDWVLAGHLRGMACHELAHLICGNYEGHGESHSYTREQLDFDSLPIMKELVEVVKQTKLRTKIERIKKEKNKQLIKQRQKKELEKIENRIKTSEKTIEGLETIDSMKDLFYWKIHKLNTMGYLDNSDIDIGDEVFCTDRKYPESFGMFVTVREKNEKDGTMVLEDRWAKINKRIKVPSSMVLKYSAWSKMKTEIENSVSFDPSMEENEAIAIMFSKYLPAYKMRKYSDMSPEKRVKSLENYLSYKAKKLIQEVKTQGEDYHKSDVLENIAFKLNSDYRHIVKDSNYWHETNFNFDTEYPAIKEIVDKTVKNLSREEKGTRKKYRTKKEKREKSPKEIKISTRLKDYSNEQIFRYAKDLGVDSGLEKYDNPAIKRMRAIMAIKRKLMEQEE